jgi:hypothetical protein
VKGPEVPEAAGDFQPLLALGLVDGISHWEKAWDSEVMDEMDDMDSMDNVYAGSLISLSISSI